MLRSSSPLPFSGDLPSRFFRSQKILGSLVPLYPSRTEERDLEAQSRWKRGPSLERYDILQVILKHATARCNPQVPTARSKSSLYYVPISYDAGKYGVMTNIS
jgi:hypothetical protein